MNNKADKRIAAEVLIGELRRFFYSPDADNLPPEVAARQRYALALDALARFLKAHGGDDVARELVKLVGYLVDLDNGTTAPTLQAKKLNNRSGDQHNVWMLRMQAVLALECLIAAGDSEKDAINHIAREYPALKRIRISSIGSWRKKYKFFEISDANSQDIYAELRSKIAGLRAQRAPDDLKVAAHEVLSDLETRARNLIL